MKEVIDLERTRRTREAEVTKDATKWTVRDALQNMLDDLDSGKLTGVDMVMITYRKHQSNNRDRFGYYSAGVDRLQAGGLLMEGVGLFLNGEE